MSHSPKLQGPKGTRDFYPEEMRRHRHLEDTWRRVSLRAGFEEVDGPIFESLELYIQKSGQEIVDQLYAFEDKGGRRVAIRPEFTPTLARMVVARQAALPRPVKWFNISRVCRYERSQKGRLREFYQWNCDILGAPDVTADAECITVAIEALRELGLTAEQVEVRLSSRKLLAALLKGLGLAEDLVPKVHAALDKRGKAPDEVVQAMLAELGLSPAQRAGLDDVFALATLDDVARRFGSAAEVSESLSELQRLFVLLEAGGVAPFVRFDIGIIRGLAYYTGPVWEVFDKRGELRSLFGGGRYDKLIETCGGQPMPACGFGAGDVTLGLLLDSHNLWPKAASAPDFYVVYASDEAVARAVRVAALLRAAGRSAQYSLHLAAFGRQMKSAAAAEARFAVIVGLPDCPDDKVRLRNMAGGQERDVSFDQLVAAGI